jgi:hypothetical protein
MFATGYIASGTQLKAKADPCGMTNEKSNVLYGYRYFALAALIGASWAGSGMIWGQTTRPVAAPPVAARPAFDAFDVATVKPADGSEKGRYIKLEGTNRFVAVAYPVKLMIAAAYDLNPKTISGGPGWMNDDKWNIEARTPGDVRPTHDEQMKMLRALLVERFGLKLHREQKEFSIYAIEVGKGGSKLKATADASGPPTVGPGVVYPQKIVLPARNATINDLASLRRMSRSLAAMWGRRRIRRRQRRCSKRSSSSWG